MNNNEESIKHWFDSEAQIWDDDWTPTNPQFWATGAYHLQQAYFFLERARGQSDLTSKLRVEADKTGRRAQILRDEQKK